MPVVFYRALVQGAGLNPINRLVKSLLRQGLNPLPVFVASLKDPVSVATLESLFTQAAPDVILNCTSFAVGSPHAGDDAQPPTRSKPRGATRRRCFKVVLAGSERRGVGRGLDMACQPATSP